MKQDAKELRRRQILDAAVATFAARGYDKTTMEDIRVASDVSKGTLYLYFHSKEALFAAVVEVMFADLLVYVEQAAAQSHADSPAARLQSFLGALNQAIGQVDHLIGLYTDFFVQAWQHDLVRAVLADAYRRYISVLASLVQQGIDEGEFHGVDARLTARIIIGALDGILLQKLIDPSADYEPALNQLSDIVMRSLGSG